ncbi:MAG: hypothetical protein ABSC94_33815, partial [Polyangiaceae bacterium]
SLATNPVVAQFAPDGKRHVIMEQFRSLARAHSREPPVNGYVRREGRDEIEAPDKLVGDSSSGP